WVASRVGRGYATNIGWGVRCPAVCWRWFPPNTPPIPPGRPLMLNIPFGRVRFCDGISRRNFLKVGTFSFGAATLTLADILRAEAKQDDLPRTKHKALINIFLGGGPPHQDMWDIKTEAPKEIRGEFSPIATNVTGIRIGET